MRSPRLFGCDEAFTAASKLTATLVNKCVVERTRCVRYRAYSQFRVHTRSSRVGYLTTFSRTHDARMVQGSMSAMAGAARNLVQLLMCIILNAADQGASRHCP